LDKRECELSKKQRTPAPGMKTKGRVKKTKQARKTGTREETPGVDSDTISPVKEKGMGERAMGPIAQLQGHLG